jgi:site-specific DNA-methyltransferase (adenine-specific)
MGGASTKGHPAPFPLELATRLVKMFSFYGDTVVDPFCGSGTTMLAAYNTGRNSVCAEIEEKYCRMAAERMAAGGGLFGDARFSFHPKVSGW